MNMGDVLAVLAFFIILAVVALFMYARITSHKTKPKKEDE